MVYFFFHSFCYELIWTSVNCCHVSIIFTSTVEECAKVDFENSEVRDWQHISCSNFFISTKCTVTDAFFSNWGKSSGVCIKESLLLCYFNRLFSVFQCSVLCLSLSLFAFHCCSSSVYFVGTLLNYYISVCCLIHFHFHHFLSAFTSVYAFDDGLVGGLFFPTSFLPTSFLLLLFYFVHQQGFCRILLLTFVLLFLHFLSFSFVLPSLLLTVFYP